VTREECVAQISIGEFAGRSRLSAKALRLYDELGVLVPARVDEETGYRYYDVGQLERARLIAALRQLAFPLAEIKEVLALDPPALAERIADHWRNLESEHAARGNLADYLVDRLSGRRSVMYEVGLREMPERALLCLKRNVDEQGAWELGKEFISILRSRSLPKIDGREGAVFSIYWGEVNAESDGPIEWCKPVPEAEAEELARGLPELTLRTEPAHREAFVALPLETAVNAAEWQAASEALQAWAREHRIDPEELDLKPDDLGVRITYLASSPITATSVPNRDFAVPFA
jgi:DNA-binding transcriptional MerR regulator